MTTELTIHELSPLALLRFAIEKGADPDHLKSLMDLVNEHNRNRAAEAFAAALTAFQSQCPTVFKGRKTTSSDKFEGYTFASFDDIMREASPILALNKIVVTFTTEPAEAGLRIVCRVRVGTHYEDSTLTIPIPAMKVNDTQKFGAAVSYAKRYAMCAALNIVVTDEDNDAADQFQNVKEEQVVEMDLLIADKTIDLARFLAWVAEATKTTVERLDQIPASFYPKAMDALRRYKRKERTS